ncbi:MAG: glutamine--tRNA ligase/YqeY domain fusion protein [Phycisphaeraceae bacterium]|nr:glutamine--tRNA ligase/YqeY domain fusion protein [Phycisphaeraceae bacterium]
MSAPNAHPDANTPADAARPRNFIEQLIDADAASGRWGVWPKSEGPDRAGKPRVHTRFPPEPNGYLHVGHAKSICLNFGLARANAGKFNLRFDDTNPAKEEREYVESIKRDVAWLASAFNAGSFDSGPHAGGLFFASDYFDKMYDHAVDLVNKGKAYVCQLTADEVSARRGKPGVPATSPHRDRPPSESLKLLDEMRRGLHPDGSMTLRARIDLASNNFNLRDPVMYRILHQHHHNTADKWCIYPMYDWAHGIEDSLEGITHSICTLEFEDHRPLYDWFIKSINEGRSPPVWHSQQIEFAKLAPSYTILSKRNLLRLVQEKFVTGWDDPRMPTIAGMRRRGYTAESIRNFCDDIGVTKTDSLIDIGRLEASLREHLNRVTPRAMAVLDPIKVVVENWPEGKTDQLDFVINPEDPAAGTRKVPFTRELWIERDDFMEVPPKKFFRLFPGGEVRLRWAYFLKCERVVKDADGNITELRCTIDPDTRGGDAPPGPDGKPSRKVKGTIHWVSAAHAMPAEVRLFDRLFSAEEPGKRTGNFIDDLNHDSKRTVRAFVEPWLANAAATRGGALVSGTGPDGAPPTGGGFQFERLGYFCTDPDSAPDPRRLVFNRTVTLKDTWAREAAKA